MALDDNKYKQRGAGGSGGGDNTAGAGAALGGQGTRVNSFNKNNANVKTGRVKARPSINGNGNPKYKAAADASASQSETLAPKGNVLSPSQVKSVLATTEDRTQAPSESSASVTPSLLGDGLLSSVSKSSNDLISRVSEGGGLLGKAYNLAKEVGSGYQQLYNKGSEHIGKSAANLLLGSDTVNKINKDVFNKEKVKAVPQSVGDQSVKEKGEGLYRGEVDGVMNYSDRPFEGGEQYNPFKPIKRAGLSITGNRLGAGLGAMQGLTRAYRDFNNPEITGTKGVSQDAYLKEQAFQESQAKYDDMIREAMSPGGRTRFGTATTVGGRDGVKNILNAKAKAAQIYQLGQNASAKNATDLYKIKEGSANTRNSLALDAQQSAFDREMDMQELGVSRSNSNNAKQKNVTSVLKAIKAQEMDTRTGALSLLDSGWSPTRIINSLGIRDTYLKGNPTKTLSDNQILQSFIRG